MSVHAVVCLRRAWPIAALLCALFAVMGASLPAAAQDVAWPSLSTSPQLEATGCDDVAIVVAVEDYAFLPDVDGAVHNANDWERFFRQGLGVESVYVLTDQEATREAMLRFARQAADETRPGATLWFVFIGHGAPLDGGQDGGLVGMDAQQTVESLSARSLPQRELLDVLEAGAQKNTVLIVDACFSGRDSNGGALARGTQPVVPMQGQLALRSNTVVLSAARADQYAGALPGANRPAFSYLLLGALRGWADDGAGYVSASDALLYTRQQLRAVKGRSQTPELAGRGDLVLSRGGVEPDPAVHNSVRPAAHPDPVGVPPAEPVDHHAYTPPARERDALVPLFLRFNLGWLARSGDAPGFAGVGDAGLTLNLAFGRKFTLPFVADEIRLLGNARVSFLTNRLAPTAGTWIRAEESVFNDEPEGKISEANNTTLSTYFLGAGVGFAWTQVFSNHRSEAIYLDLAGGVVGFLSDPCTEWEARHSGDFFSWNEANCSARASESYRAPGVEATLGYRWVVFDLGVTMQYSRLLELGVTPFVGLNLDF